MKDNKEIERSWILPYFPTLTFSHAITHNIYYLLSNDLGEMRIVERFLKDGKTYSLTVKNIGDLSRNEYEDDNLPEWAFLILKKEYKFMVSKTRHFLNYKNYQLEIDDYNYRVVNVGLFHNKESFQDKVKLECEFSSEEEANRFVLPEWAAGAEEVTYKPEYKNVCIANKGWPENKSSLTMGGWPK